MFYQMNIILRRRKLGKTSCDAISQLSGIQVIRNDIEKWPGPSNWLFRWGCTSQIKDDVLHTVNTADAIHAVNDKWATRFLLGINNIPIPNTWPNIDEYVHFNEKEGPVIIRPLNHHQGKHIYLCKDLVEIDKTCKKLGKYYISEYIEKDREFRIYVISGRVVCVAEKFVENKDQVAWNKALGGSFRNVKWKDWPVQACVDSIKACKVMGLDFGGVDVIMKEGKHYILEINSAPSLTSAYRQQCFATAFKAIIDTGQKQLPELGPVKTYKAVIHPAIRKGNEE